MTLRIVRIESNILLKDDRKWPLPFYFRTQTSQECPESAPLFNLKILAGGTHNIVNSLGTLKTVNQREI